MKKSIIVIVCLVMMTVLSLVFFQAIQPKEEKFFLDTSSKEKFEESLELSKIKVLQSFQQTMGGDVQPIVQISLGNGYNYFGYDKDYVGVSSSHIIYGDFQILGDLDVADAHWVTKFDYNDDYIFSYSEELNLYQIIDSAEKSYVLKTENKKEFENKAVELLGRKIKWIKKPKK